ncbi:hypothetical protein AB4Y43_01425 [Paraburkholderia sp. BR10872]|uniref:hypothetical protein n=1 Tax=Paraburkholderia sp. BR10872 TaxID=3236989 RepID=UPI0034D1E584
MDHLRIPLAPALNEFAAKSINDAFQMTGKGLPCSVVSVSGAIITVKFEVNSQFTLPNVTVPLFGPEYIRYPIQKGDKGAVVPFDAYLGGMSGLGGGVADLTQRANLSTLVFLPIGNKLWTSVDPNAVTIYGPNGVVLRDTGSNSIITLTPSSIAIVAPNQIQLKTGSTTMTLTPTGWSITGSNGSLSDGSHTTSVSLMNSTWAALLAWLDGHEHSNGNGGANTGVPTTSAPTGNIAP